MSYVGNCSIITLSHEENAMISNNLLTGILPEITWQCDVIEGNFM
jgi:hypothetical protein